MNRVVKGLAPLGVAGLLIVGLAGPANAYAGAEQGTKYCNSEGPVATKIRADGAHSHTQRDYTRVYPDAGYVHNTYVGRGYASASYYITGGIGYFSTADSYAYCAVD